MFDFDKIMRYGAMPVLLQICLTPFYYCKDTNKCIVNNAYH